MSTPDQLEAAIRVDGRPARDALAARYLWSRTTNLGGGRRGGSRTIWWWWWAAGTDVARRHRLRATSSSGARRLHANAAVAPARRRVISPRGPTPPGSTSPRDSVRRWARRWRGSRELIDEAWRWKQMLGGALRQSGIVAAACLHALEHHVERLADDHRNARLLADGLGALPEVEADRDGADEHRGLRGPGRGRLSAASSTPSS